MYVGLLRDFPFAREGSLFWPWKKAWKLSKLVWNDSILVVASRCMLSCSGIFHLLAKARIFGLGKRHGNSRNLFGMIVFWWWQADVCCLAQRFSICSRRLAFFALQKKHGNSWNLFGMMGFWWSQSDIRWLALRVSICSRRLAFLALEKGMETLGNNGFLG